MLLAIALTAGALLTAPGQLALPQPRPTAAQEDAEAGFTRTLTFPGDAAYQLASGASKATFLSGAHVRLKSLHITSIGSLPDGGYVRLRAFGGNTDTLLIPVPAGGDTGEGYSFDLPLDGFLMPDGLQVVADPGIEGSLVIVEEPRLSARAATVVITLDQVRQILGKSTPHPFDGQAKWGTVPTQTAYAATWNSAIDTEVFEVQLPTGFTHVGSGHARLILAHHPLENAASTCATETTLEEGCDIGGYVYASPTSMLSDTWPNDNSVDNLEADFWWLIQMLGVDPDDLNMVGFSLGGQQTSRFMCTHRDPAGLMLRTACSVAADWEQLVWQRKQHKNTNLGQSVPNPPGPDYLCDPAPDDPNNTKFRSQQQRLDQLGGPWPGADGVSAVGLQWRASAILALDPASYAETGPLTDLDPITPAVSAADIPGATIDTSRSLAASGLWTPHLIVYGEDDGVIIIPPLTEKLLELYHAVNPNGKIGFAPEVINVGMWGGLGAHTWDILNVGLYLEWVDNAPPVIRHPQTFEYVTHRDSTSSYLSVVRSNIHDLSRVRCTLVTTPGSEGWLLSNEVRLTRVTIDVSQTLLAGFDFGGGTPLHVTTGTSYEIVLKNLPYVPTGAFGTNVGTVTIGVDGANSIEIEPAGAGGVFALIK